MNIYLIKESDEPFCVKAETMHEAVKISERSYLDDRLGSLEYNELIESLYYHEQILQSCSFIGVLKN